MWQQVEQVEQAELHAAFEEVQDTNEVVETLTEMCSIRRGRSCCLHLRRRTG